MLKLIALASFNAPAVIVFVTAVPPPIHSTNGVPVVVKLVTVAEFQIVLVVVALITIFPLPNAIVLALALELEKAGTVKTLSFNVTVPAVKVYVPVLAFDPRFSAPLVCVIASVVDRF